MLHEFLSRHTAELIAICREKVSTRPVPSATDTESQRGIPYFVQQLIRALRVEENPVTGSADLVASADAEMAHSAEQHGGALYAQGFSVGQVVHDYGDLCQAITELAMKHGDAITTAEFHTLNRCLDDAIAGAVSAFEQRSSRAIQAEGIVTSNERLGVLAHELRNLLASGILALEALKSGRVALRGATGAVLDRSLNGMRNLIDRSFTEVRLGAGTPVSRVPIAVSDFIAEVQIAAALEASIKGCHLTVAPVDAGLSIEGDQSLLAAALANLLQNAFKFTQPRTCVQLRAFAAGDRVLMEVEDQCGGLKGEPETLRRAFQQRGLDRTGLGLGLSIAQRAVTANGGKLHIRNLPGIGCVFTIDLPRLA